MPSSRSGRGSRSAAPPEPARTGEVARRVYFEFMPAGNAMRVTAIDERTGTEATIMGPANAGQAALQRAALAKLRYVLGRGK